MLREYLSVAKEALSAQKEIYQVKEERLRLAQQQYKQLNDAWREKSSSQTSRKTRAQTLPRSGRTAAGRTQGESAQSPLFRERGRRRSNLAPSRIGER